MIIINGTLAGLLGNYSSTVIVHIVGLIAVLIVALIKKQILFEIKNILFYLYSAGAIGVFTVLLNNLTFNRIGASLIIALGLLGQSVASILIDHFGLLEMKVVKYRKKKFIGLSFVVLGIVIMSIF